MDAGQAGKKYPATEKSFRSTTSAASYTNRGFKIVVDRKQRKLRFIFDLAKADISDPEIVLWLNSVEKRAGLGQLQPEPYWGLDDLQYAIGTKIRNCFYVIVDRRIEDSHEFFLYKELYVLSGFSFEKFIIAVENRSVLIDFDTRTGHNHGTKFRLRQGCWKDLYASVQRAI